jgi:hypothetical protein
MGYGIAPDEILVKFNTKLVDEVLPLATATTVLPFVITPPFVVAVVTDANDTVVAVLAVTVNDPLNVAVGEFAIYTRDPTGKIAFPVVLVGRL